MGVHQHHDFLPELDRSPPAGRLPCRNCAAVVAAVAGGDGWRAGRSSRPSRRCSRRPPQGSRSPRHRRKGPRQCAGPPGRGSGPRRRPALSPRLSQGFLGHCSLAWERVVVARLARALGGQGVGHTELRVGALFPGRSSAKGRPGYVMFATTLIYVIALALCLVAGVAVAATISPRGRWLTPATPLSVPRPSSSRAISWAFRERPGDADRPGPDHGGGARGRSAPGGWL